MKKVDDDGGLDRTGAKMYEEHYRLESRHQGIRRTNTQYLTENPILPLKIKKRTKS